MSEIRKFIELSEIILIQLRDAGAFADERSRSGMIEWVRLLLNSAQFCGPVRVQEGPNADFLLENGFLKFAENGRYALSHLSSLLRSESMSTRYVRTHRQKNERKQAAAKDLLSIRIYSDQFHKLKKALEYTPGSTAAICAVPFLQFAAVRTSNGVIPALESESTIRISSWTGIPQHEAEGILRELRQCGLIDPEGRIAYCENIRIRTKNAERCRKWREKKQQRKEPSG